MVIRRRGTFLLTLLLATIGVLYLTLLLNKVDFEAAFVPSLIAGEAYIRPLNVVTAFPSTWTTDGLQSCTVGTPMYDDYCVFSPYTKNDKRNSNRSSADGGSLVTLCTQSTVEFLKHVLVLCHRWSNPVSVAVYAPPEDYSNARIVVHLLRQCDPCIRFWVDWHFIFPRLESEKVPSVDEFQLTRDCGTITKVNGYKKRKSQGTYPINVARNVARLLTTTPFVFSIDIELYPSLNIPAKFERMLRSQVLGPENQVWVFPVFEVHSKARAPLLKSELRSMFSRKQAISFHQYRCNICHKIPNLTQWMALGGKSTSEVEDSLEPLRIYTTVKRNRHYKLQEWEPFFIGTTKDPEFDIRLSWEGKQNKMQMAYEMCMRDYDFHIIENAFLVHTPGINVYNATKDKERGKHVFHNRKVINMVKKQLISKYGLKNDC